MRRTVLIPLIYAFILVESFWMYHILQYLCTQPNLTDKLYLLWYSTLSLVLQTFSIFYWLFSVTRQSLQVRIVPHSTYLMNFLISVVRECPLPPSLSIFPPIILWRSLSPCLIVCPINLYLPFLIDFNNCLDSFISLSTLSSVLNSVQLTFGRSSPAPHFEAFEISIYYILKF